MTIDEKEIVSQPIQLNSSVSDRLWLLQIEGKESHFGGKLPEIEFGWVPHQLSFIARGSSPFQLAYGSAVAEMTDFGFNSLMKSLKVARGGQPVVPQTVQVVGAQKGLGGAERLIPPPIVKPLPWKQWALWLALGLALLFVGGMAFRLYGELSAKKA